MSRKALLIERLITEREVPAPSQRHADLKRLLMAVDWVVHESEECPNDPENRLSPSLVIAHHTDIYKPTLIEWCTAHESSWLLLHTHAWNGRQVAHSVERGVTVVELGSETLLRRLNSFLGRWGSPDAALVAELGVSAYPQNLVSLYLIALALRSAEASMRDQLLKEDWASLLQAARGEAAARGLGELPQDPFDTETSPEWALQLRKCLASIAGPNGPVVSE